MSKLKIEALRWSINHSMKQMGFARKPLLISYSNERLAPSECGKHEKRIVIGDDCITTYEHYSEHGNPFLAHVYTDYYRFMRGWFAPIVARSVTYWLINLPEWKETQEAGKASGSMFDHLMWSTKTSGDAFRKMYLKLHECVMHRRNKLVKWLLFGRPEQKIQSGKALVGTWISQDQYKLKYEYDGSQLLRYDDAGPKRFEYKVISEGDHFLDIELKFLPAGKIFHETLYFSDNYQIIEQQYGTSSFGVLKKAEP